jgi:hypothetical protein
MAFEIQIHTSTLVSLIENSMQQGFRTRCLPSAPPFYVDHVDVEAGKTTVSESGGGVDFVVTVDVFVVTADAVNAAPNGTPDGATTPVGQATITLHLSLSNTATLTLACSAVNLGSLIETFLGSQASTVEQQIQQAIGTVGSLDVSTIVAGIGLPAPSASGLAIVGASVLIRFDSMGPGQERLQSGQDWCLFADANTMVALVETKLNAMLAGVSSEITSSTTTAAWAPSGTTPEMKVEVSGKAQVPDPFSGDVFVNADVVIGLIHTFIVNDGTAADLTLDVSWSVAVDLGWFLDFLVPAWVIDLVVNEVAGGLVDPTTFGGIKLGSHEFEMLISLPPLSFGSASFNYNSVVGLSDGMVLGGSVKLPPAPDLSTLTIDAGTFPDSYEQVVDCSKGSQTDEATLANVTVAAGASLFDAGAICDVHLVSPASPPVSLTPYLTVPADGTVTESTTVAVTLPGTVGVSLSNDPQRFQFWVQTARGVRLLDLGTPPSPLDDQGNLNYHLVVIDDCPVAVDPWYRVFHMYNPKWSVDPPESWTERLEQTERFETVLIDVGVQAGSLVRFDMPIMGAGVGSTFAADGGGHALVPAVLAARSDDESARLSTADRQALGDMGVSTAVFERVAVLDTPGAVLHELTERGGAAFVTSTFEGGRTQTVRVGGLRIPQTLGAGPGAAGGGGPAIRGGNGMPAGAAGDPAEGGIPGLVALHPVPGFESEGVQVAELEDGSHVAVVQECGELRATGTIPAWPHMPPAGDAWAISSSTGDRIAVFAVSRTAAAGSSEPGAHGPGHGRGHHDCGCGKHGHQGLHSHGKHHHPGHGKPHHRPCD